MKNKAIKLQVAVDLNCLSDIDRFSLRLRLTEINSPQNN